MNRLGGLLLIGWIGVAVWLSDRWIWVVPGLGGVVAGVAFSKGQRRPRSRSTTGGWHTGGLGPLLVLAGFVYLYLTFLILEFTRVRELIELEDAAPLPSRLLLLGCAGLSLILLGLSAMLLLNLKTPAWLARSWEWLLEER